MRIAVLSGKGGTGKTLISVNLSYVKGKSVYIDCDVEAPNGRLFLKPEVKHLEKVNVTVPAVNSEICNGCRICVDFCKFNAMAYIKEKLLVFKELCHSCNGCIMLCPENALSEIKRNIGYIEYGETKSIKVRTGILNTGEASGVPIIRKLLANLSKFDYAIVDCPPGSSCLVMESIKDADFCIMVAEPTKFGVHNLNMVYNLVKLFKKPNAVIVNKDIGDKSIIENYCMENRIKILESIKYDDHLASANSEGVIISNETKYYNLFKNILNKIEEEVLNEAACNTER